MRIIQAVFLIASVVLAIHASHAVSVRDDKLLGIFYILLAIYALIIMRHEFYRA
jgi:hypothetical protein